jgi:hypothetical protein
MIRNVTSKNKPYVGNIAMTETSNSNVSPIKLVGGPVSLALPCVLLRFAAHQLEFSVLLLSDRTVFVPEWLNAQLNFAVIERVKQFEKDHRIVIHELLKRARQEVSSNVPLRTVGSVVDKPNLNQAKELVFRVTLEDSDVVLHISWLLVPCQIHLSNEQQRISERLFQAYDIALEYMQANTEELETLGFDTSMLRSSIQDWLRYGERLRVGSETEYAPDSPK